MTTKSFLYKSFATLALLAVTATNAIGQIRDTYEDVTVQHLLKNKWYQMRENAGLSESAKDLDAFDDSNPTEENTYTGTEIQSTHTYIDTLYVHKGSSVVLTLPTVQNGFDASGALQNGNRSSTRSYQRWYNFVTEGDFQWSTRRESGDLISVASNNLCYRVSNGYISGVGVTGTICAEVTFHYPTNVDYDDYGYNNGPAGNNYYIVACDVSGYTDYHNNLRDNRPSFTEPTLQLRCIYYIVGVDDRDNTPGWETGMGRLSNTAYQGGDGQGKKFLEEYDITFPTNHLGIQTDELVALSKRANGYRIPGDDNDELKVNITSTNGMKLIKNSRSDETNVVHGGQVLDTVVTISGTQRTISFRPNGAERYEPWSVVSGSTATIVVTKEVDDITYNLAKFNLTFERQNRLLTQHQIARIDGVADGEEDVTRENWYRTSFRSRTPKYLRENYTLLTSRTFDYDTDVQGLFDGIHRWYYPFPLGWGFSSYAFYDGTGEPDFDNDSGVMGSYENNPWPEWGSYAITNQYLSYGDRQRSTEYGYAGGPTDPSLGGKSGTGYFLYVDASDRPGTVATLPFEENLCPGTELFVSAWVKSGDELYNGGRAYNRDNAAMLFTIFGVRGDGVRVPLYRHSTGQINTTSFLGWVGATDVDEYTDANGYGRNQNDWYQIYFSFINENELSDEFVSYELRVDNNCGSTAGGDFYLDEIEVFIAQPTATVTQKGLACTGQRTLLRSALNWEQLCERVGNDPDETDESLQPEAIDFCFINKAQYDLLLDGIANPTQEQIENAIQQTMVWIGPGEDPTEYGQYNRQIATLSWHQHFESNTEYVPENENLIVSNPQADFDNDVFYFYRSGTADEGNRELVLDFYAAMTPNTPYEMLILDSPGNGQVSTVADFAAMMNDPCAIKSDFFVTAQTLIRINGQVAPPQTDFCLGQAFNFSAQVQVPRLDDNGEIVRDPETGEAEYVPLDAEVCFDWFFGSQPEFNMAQENFGGESVQSALKSLRDIDEYRDVETLDGVVPVAAEPGVHDGLTQNQIDLLKHYIGQPAPSGGLNSKLVLHRPSLDIVVLESGAEFVISPIPIDKPAESEISDTEWERICWEYVPLTLKASGESPKLAAGFNSILNYPEGYYPALRIGLGQIEDAEYQQRGGKSIKISLRGAEYTSDDVESLGLIDNADVDYTNIYMTGTDDPQYDEYFAADRYSDTYLPIGKILSLEAHEYVEGSTFVNEASVQFYVGQEQRLVDGSSFTFNPREGYYYRFAVNFAEKGRNVTNSCWGTFPIEMKVVPENLVWQGGADGALKNWNNDANWKRADASDLHAEGTSYTTNDANGTDNGFVPMLFSNVVMPEGSRAHLYMAGYVDGGALFQGKDNRPAGMEDPTENIQYDLMVYDDDPDTHTGNLTTQRYRVNICNDIHFNEGAQMLHAEQLIYTKASMDVPVPTKKWTLVSTPLRGVVAGDWYTNTDGKQTGEELFTDITFDATKHNRLNPAVYQRSWTRAANIIENAGATSTTPVSFGALWSSAYNDAGVPYTAGGGFSIKAADVANGSGTLVFRMPKDDANYDYSSTSTSLDRTNAGRLLISDMADRSTPNAYTGTEPKTVTLTPSADGNYMIVGNPFMAPLDIETFLDANAKTLEKVYWGETEHGPVVGTGSWNSDQVTGTGHSIEPYGAFFVKKRSADASNEVTFSADMQKLTDAGMSQGTETNALVITASGTTKRSTALLAYDDAAADAFSAGEDAQLITDLTGNGIDAPLAYTVAGTTAAAINVVSTTRRIPMGVFAADDEVTTLSFSGTATLRNPRLYDAALQTETPLTDATTLSVSGASHGRYFIISDGAAPTGISGVDGDGATELSVYSVTSGEVIVAASAPIGLVNVYSAGGALLKSVDAAGAKECTVSGLPADVVVVRVALPGATEARKLKVKK